MSIRALILAAALVWPAVAPAADPLSAAEFEAYTTGKTLFYGVNGEIYGAERYLPGRRVVWTFLDGDCKDGVWYEQNGDICFEYEDFGPPQCWRFTLGPNGLIAEFTSDPNVAEFYEAQDTGGEMQCLGPKIGA